MKAETNWVSYQPTFPIFQVNPVLSLINATPNLYTPFNVDTLLSLVALLFVFATNPWTILFVVYLFLLLFSLIPSPFCLSSIHNPIVSARWLHAFWTPLVVSLNLIQDLVILLRIFILTLFCFVALALKVLPCIPSRVLKVFLLLSLFHPFSFLFLSLFPSLEFA